jgi:AraC family transcriptional regulator, activator of mtrCDE
MMQGQVDVFVGLAPLLRVRPVLEQLCQFGAQWSSAHEPEKDGWAPFHIVTHGACRLDVEGHCGIVLKAGDVAVLPHGGRHVVQALPEVAGAPSAMRVYRRQHDDLVMKTNVDGAPDTKLICGRLRFELADNNMVLMALPAVIILSAADRFDALRLRTLVDTMQAELDEDRLGAAAVASDIASALMVVILRAHLEKAPRNRGVLALLAHRQSARALACMLAEPARGWTLDELAKRASTSRATLVRLFRKNAGMAPLAFLAEFRLSLARHRIQVTTMSVAVIAEDVGYRSQTAFSRAYHRRFGAAPGTGRRGEMAAMANAACGAIPTGGTDERQETGRPSA